MLIQTPPLLRYRRAVLIGVALFFGITFAVRVTAPERDGWSPSDLLVMASFAAILVMIFLGLMSRQSLGPSSFTVRPDRRAYIVPVRPDWVWTASWHTGLVTTIVGDVLADWPASPGPLDIDDLAICALLMSLLLGLVIPAWRGISLELRPDGLVQRLPLGTLRVPWEALRPDDPSRLGVDALSLRLDYRRPDLVRWRGMGWFGRKAIRVGHAHPGFLADAIGFYAAHPAERPGIGTAAGHDRLLHALRAAPLDVEENRAG